MKSLLRTKRVHYSAGVATVLTLVLLCISGVPGTVQAAAGDFAQHLWKPQPITSAEARQAGFHPGGEGGQWMRSIRWSQADPNVLIMGTDVGGVYRSVDGGDHWQSAMVGWNARGTTDFAFDPKNADRVLGVGGNSSDDYSGHQPSGLYLSTDKGASWKQVLPQTAGDDSQESVTYDPSSFDPALGYCTVAYYATAYNGLYKSTDGGQTWSQINTAFSGGRVRVHPTKGYVYVTSDKNPDYGTPYGFYKSTDGGVTFRRIANMDRYTYGLDVSPADPDKVWVARYDWVWVSDDAGETFTNTGTQGLPSTFEVPFTNVTVSPIDPNYMAVSWQGNNYNWERLYSTDGGKTWAQSNYADGTGVCDPNNRVAKYSLLPCNVRPGIWAYSPVQPSVAFSNGGDWLTKTTDGGANYIWHNNGYNGIFVPTFNFNPNNPDTVLMASKDYNSYLTTDGGKVWTYAPSGFDYGGYGFGGFALDSKVMWLANDIYQYNVYLEESTDGGKTWFYPQYNGQNIVLADGGTKWDLVSYADPTNNDIGFIGAWRTVDHGKTWGQMTGVTDVFTSNPTGQRELYGKNGADVVVSYDHGATWQTLFTVPGGFRQMAFDQIHNRFWIATASLINGSTSLMKYENGQLTTVTTPADQYGTTRVAAVAVDPGDPNVIYVGNDRNIWTASNSLLRSTDGGQTWQNLTVETPLVNGHVAGGAHEVWWIEVNPKTHEAWMATNCFGIWKLPPVHGDK